MKIFVPAVMAAMVCACSFIGINQADAAAIQNTVKNQAINPALLHLRGPGVGWLSGQPDPNPDMNEPDMSNWQIFIGINKASPSQHQVGPNNVTTNDALWETWADDGLTFPASPDPAHPPQWPSTATNFPLKRLVLPFQNVIRRQLEMRKPLQMEIFRKPVDAAQLFKLNPKKPPVGMTPEILEIQAGGGEEVRRNQSDFQFIIDNQLFYTQGLRNAFTAGVPITFPSTAIEIKARWTPITAAQKSQYHWNYDSQGNLYGLIALHIMTKRLGNWTWATWEWVGNSGRCDYIGCHDAFGVTPADVAPKTPVNGGYPPGTLTPALLAKFTAAGLSAEWQNYRLKGSQTLFTNTTGQATLLGNSITEAGFVPSSSCITCHGQASVNNSGQINPSFGFTSGGQSSNGPLLPSMFWNSATPPTLQYMPMDFVWAFSQASPAPGVP
ncbi:hypothetical protein [Dyella silvatica]|uniref:hypothetical protein n=1 Tax=Dyella silvatica TaxID=2992128 RepID=UPI002259BCB4|nr:hypothetical protein [Dyella silvatica]